MTRLARRSQLGFLLLLAGALAGCRGDSREGPYARKVSEVMPKIEQATGLKFKTRPKVETRTKEQVREFLLKKFNEAEPMQEIAGEAAAYKAFGLIPEAMDLKKFLTELYTEQIAGFYDPDTKTLYLINGTDDATAGITLTHELVHALQDQYLNLDSIQKATGDDDRALAAQAVIEGQATYEQLAIMLGGRGNIAAALPGGWDRMREMIRQNQSSMPVFASAPMVIQETAIFPYLSGADFIRRFHDRRPDQVPYKDMPVSTEQILHTPAYFGTPPDEPTMVTLPAPAYGTKVFENDMGEFGVRLLVFQHTNDQEGALTAATGWDGDRYVIVNTPGGRAVAWVTVWDTPLDAVQFVEQMDAATRKRYGAGAPTALPANGKQFTGSGRTVELRPLEIGNRTAVLYVDVPAGQSTALIDAGKVTLKGGVP